jgi:hypothetical protein
VTSFLTYCSHLYLGLPLEHFPFTFILKTLRFSLHSFFKLYIKMKLYQISPCWWYLPQCFIQKGEKIVIRPRAVVEPWCPGQWPGAFLSAGAQLSHFLRQWSQVNVWEWKQHMSVFFKKNFFIPFF